jgi:hypothetical protein
MTSVDAVARATLYEGYLLYPYRATAIKNRQRWTTGGLLPSAYCAQHKDEASALRVECLVEGDAATTLDVEVRFLQLFDGLATESQRAVERRVVMPQQVIRDVLVHPVTLQAIYDGEPGAHRIEVSVRGTVVPVSEGTLKVRVDVANATVLAEPPPNRDSAMTSALAACHVVLHVKGGAFVSLFDPPQRLLDETRGCMNAGVWPVLVGSEGARDTMLASPIILYDHPQIAPESPGDLFDATEIDEILTLRILALTDEEKREMANGDSIARALLERTQQLNPDQLQALHGRLQRTPRRDAAPFRVGDRVRLKPRGKADIMDLALAGKLATVEAIEYDFEDRVHVVVTLDDDPGRDLGLARMPGHRFFFAPEDLERATDA